MPDARPVVLDTNVIIDAFVRSHDARSRGSIEMLRRIERGEYRGVIPTPVLVEVYYVVLDVTHDPLRAERTLDKLLALPHMTTQAVELEHAVVAMRMVRESNYFRMGSGNKLGRRTEGLSMVDALVLAVGASIPRAVVCSSESRFSQVKGVKVLRPWDLASEEPMVLSGGRS
jgi:predicted nucleic acid-binding protein